MIAHGHKTTMKPKMISLIPTLVVAAFVACSGTAFAQTEILTFDNPPAVGGFNQYLSVPNGYGGLQWQYFQYMDGITQAPNTAPEATAPR